MKLYTTPPLTIVDYPADSYHYGNNRLSYEVIWLHHTGGTDSKDWLSKTSPRNKPVSSHRLVQRGVLYKIVPDDKVAWTQGNVCFDSIYGHDIDPNRVSLSIEIENNGIDEPYSSIDIGLVADQCVEWIGMYGFLPILYHMNCDVNKNDPYNFPRDMFDRFVIDRMRQYL